jgi:hypothetical protein
MMDRLIFDIQNHGSHLIDCHLVRYHNLKLVPDMFKTKITEIAYSISAILNTIQKYI